MSTMEKKQTSNQVMVKLYEETFHGKGNTDDINTWRNLQYW
jgi:hypothetical protein